MTILLSKRTCPKPICNFLKVAESFLKLIPQSWDEQLFCVYLFTSNKVQRTALRYCSLGNTHREIWYCIGCHKHTTMTTISHKPIIYQVVYFENSYHFKAIIVMKLSSIAHILLKLSPSVYISMINLLIDGRALALTTMTFYPLWTALHGIHALLTN